MSEDRCRCCGEDLEHYDECQVEYGVCLACFAELTNDEDLMLAYVEKHEKEFYADYCYGVEGNCYVEAIALFKREINRDIELRKPYALKYLRDFCHNDTSDYIDFCIKKMNK